MPYYALRKIEDENYSHIYDYRTLSIVPACHRESDNGGQQQTEEAGEGSRIYSNKAYRTGTVIKYTR